MRIMLFTLAATALLASPASAQSTGPDNPTWDLDNPGSCEGAMRGGRNSPGGDREYGGLNDELVPFVEFLNDNDSNFGEFLSEAMGTLCENPPPGLEG